MNSEIFRSVDPILCQQSPTFQGSPSRVCIYTPERIGSRQITVVVVEHIIATRVCPRYPAHNPLLIAWHGNLVGEKKSIVIVGLGDRPIDTVLRTVIKARPALMKIDCSIQAHLQFSQEGRTEMTAVPQGALHSSVGAPLCSSPLES
ncbi:hypothetical protein AAFF_G00287740 [Aldrovandia affinis]|uniref:Uncharacterized protein n=1 Tax=Aldrovandia affinis TaxID=143900 RepID=A0AAD7WS81_9TELE|nr:hypothetical protein AAFF_G00287740 [Aldrovandia affinis]